MAIYLHLYPPYWSRIKLLFGTALLVLLSANSSEQDSFQSYRFNISNTKSPINAELRAALFQALLLSTFLKYHQLISLSPQFHLFAVLGFIIYSYCLIWYDNSSLLEFFYNLQPNITTCLKTVI